MELTGRGMDARRLYACLALVACAVGVMLARPTQSSAAATVPVGFDHQLAAVVGFPTGMAFTPDGRLLLAAQTGELRVYQNGALQSTPAIDLSGKVCTNIERGLEGVAVDPAFADNHYVYLFYTYNRGSTSCGTDPADPASQPVNRVSRFVLGNDNVILPSSETILLDNIPSISGNHNAGDLGFGKDGYLYVTVGDSGCDYIQQNAAACGPWNNNARYPNLLAGKVLRITGDGDIPLGNPHLGPGSSRCNLTGSTAPGDWCQEIYATGLRNPFRFAFNPNVEDTLFYINDVGLDTWEEIDQGAAGADYGWNVREGHCAIQSSSDCGPPPAGMTNPIYDYSHSSGCTSVTAGAFVPNGVWPPEYDNTYLFADFVCGKLLMLVPDGTGGYTSTEFGSGLGGPVDMAFGPPNSATKSLYYMSWASPPGLYKITYTGGANRSPVAVANADVTSGSVPLNVNFDGSQSSDPDNDTLTYDWDFGDGSSHSSEASPSHQYDTAGTYTATLTVTDGHGGHNTATIRIDSGDVAPTPTISSPTSGQQFAVAQPITLSGSATDPEDGTLPDSQLTWRVIKHHATHTHPFLPPTSGNDVTIVPPSPEDYSSTMNSYLEVFLTATDSKGVSTTVSRDIHPHLVTLSFATNPPGLTTLLNGATAPSSFTSWEGWHLPISTTSPQYDSGGLGQTFVSWSDGGAQSHTVITPATATTYTANFTSNYVHPRGASPNRIPLVPSYRPCKSPDLTHGPPLAYGSCSGPKLASSYLTLGTPDANGAPARSTGFVRFTARQGKTSTPENEADVKIDVMLSDVSNQGPALSDYLGDLQLRTGLRETDKLSGNSTSDPATIRDFLFNVRVPCTPTVGTEGSTCETHTTADAVLPGTIVESKRTLWEILQVRVYDGGSDGSISTPGNTLFATQGLFIP